jgi:hypothetical protein
MGSLQVQPEQPPKSVEAQGGPHRGESRHEELWHYSTRLNPDKDVVLRIECIGDAEAKVHSCIHRWQNEIECQPAATQMR